MLSTPVGLATALVGGVARFLATNLGIGAAYSGTDPGAAAGCTFTLKTDGTWEISFGGGDTGSGTPLTGTWLTGGSAADYEVKYTPSNEVGAPSITNGAAAFTAVSANRSITVNKTGADASADVLIEIQKTADTTESVSGSTNLAANGA